MHQGQIGIGDRLREARQARGLSQADLAGDALSASYVSLVEAGKRHPTEPALEHLAHRLGVDVAWLRDGVDAARARQVRLDVGYAELALAGGDLERAHAAFAALLDQPDLDEDLDYRVRYGLAKAAERRGDLEEAVTQLARLAERARRRPDAAPWLDVAVSLCRVHTAAGELDRAVAHGEAALARARDAGLDGTDDYVRLACTVLNAHLERGELTLAGTLAGELMALAEGLGAPHSRGAAYWNAALVAEARGEAAQALRLVDRALALFGESDDQRNLARLRTAYAFLLLQQDAPAAAEALAMLDGARADLVTHAGQVDVSSCDTERARAMWLMGRVAEARELLGRVLAELGAGSRVEAARARVLLGQVLWSAGDEDGCLAQCAVAANMLGAMGANRQSATAWRELGDLYRTVECAAEAMDAYDRALQAVRVPAKPGVPAPARVLPGLVG